MLDAYAGKIWPACRLETLHSWNAGFERAIGYGPLGTPVLWKILALNMHKLEIGVEDNLVFPTEFQDAQYTQGNSRLQYTDAALNDRPDPPV